MRPAQEDPGRAGRRVTETSIYPDRDANAMRRRSFMHAGALATAITWFWALTGATDNGADVGVTKSSGVIPSLQSDGLRGNQAWI
jgi:hypothetical protein